MTIYSSIIDRIVEKKIESILNNSEIESGHNGPYYDCEKKGRNISHWIYTLSEYYTRTKDEKYKKAIRKLSEYYYQNKDYTKYGVYYCRDKEGKDCVNGTIGQAWIIEGLIAAAKVLNDISLYERAVNVFKALPFDINNGMWERIEIDGNNLGLDITYNHQLWYAAAGAEILDYIYDSEIDKNIKSFLDRSLETFWVMPNGVICHFANCYTNGKEKFKNYIKYTKHMIEIKLNNPSIEYKEIGYHMFDMYGFALLQDQYGSHPLFTTKKFKRAIKYCISREYIEKLTGFGREKDATNLESLNVERSINTYGIPYNSPAFELPYIAEKFNLQAIEICDYLWKYQVEKTYNSENASFCNNTEDSSVLEARIYELVRSNTFWKDDSI